MRQFVVRTDVTEAAGLGEPAEMVATVCLPDDVSVVPSVVAFGWPGGGYSRGYFTFDMPGSSGGGEAGFHTSRGWIVVAVDHLNVGDSTHPSDPSKLNFRNLAATSHALVESILDRLAAGTLVDGLAPVVDPLRIAIGQSMGGATTVLTEGTFPTYDGVAILGWSAYHTLIPAPPGTKLGRRVFVPRGTNIADIDPEIFERTMPEMAYDERGYPLCTPAFHYDDVPADVVARDMTHYPTRDGNLPEWGADSMPPCAMTMMSPGSMSTEAASIQVPVFVGAGERDTVPFPKNEVPLYQQSPDITVFVCDTMAHMHNFASTRELMWARVHSWADTVGVMRAARRAFAD